MARYQFKEEDAFGLASKLGIEIRRFGDELQFKSCPYCMNGSHGNDFWKFSINSKSGAFKCLRGSCGKQGHFAELARDFNYDISDKLPKTYKKLQQPSKPIESNQVAIDYLFTRGISPTTTKLYEITGHRNFNNIICFPFFDDKNQLQFIKYRNTAFKKGDKGAKEWSEKDAMPILFGMKQANQFDKPLIITEGQIDSLSVAEAGVPNAVSVPTGAQGFTWIQPCWEWINKFSEVIVFGDYENGSISLIDTLKNRLPMTVKCVRKQDYLGEKDANEILMNYGKPAILKAIQNAELPKINNIIDLSTVKSVNIDELEKIKTGISAIDRVIGGMCMGQVICLTGKAGDGKSTFMSQLICSALNQNESVFAYSGELANFHFKRWIDFQLAGSKNIETTKNKYGDELYNIKEEVIEQISNWYKGRCFLYDNEYLPEDKSEAEGVLETAEKVIKQYNTRLICIDNLMTAMDYNGNGKLDLNQAQSMFVGKLKKLAMKYQVVVILVAHPRKGREGVVNNDEISGSADITNKVDIVMGYARADKKKTTADSRLSIMKNRLFGRLAMGENEIELYYSPATKRIFEFGKTETIYNWDKAGIDKTIRDSAQQIEMKLDENGIPQLVECDDEMEQLPF